MIRPRYRISGIGAYQYRHPSKKDTGNINKERLARIGGNEL